MSKTRTTLQPALHRAQIQLDKLEARSVILDRDGDAWQAGGVGSVGMFWYRAYGGEGISSFELAQRGPIKVVHRAKLDAA